VSPVDLRGAVVWAVGPYVREAPFRIYRTDAEPLSLPDAAALFAAAGKAETVAAPVRFHASALDAQNVLGRLDVNEIRVVHERSAKLLSLDLFNLIREEIVKLRELQRQRQAQSEF
jgi:hypothetical protein